jgi:biotin-(acetyl-CoA carboxylase) ligase
MEESIVLRGRQIGESRDGDEMITGITRGLDTDGALRLETDRGELVTVRAGDVVSLRATGNQ